MASYDETLWTRRLFGCLARNTQQNTEASRRRESEASRGTEVEGPIRIETEAGLSHLAATPSPMVTAMAPVVSNRSLALSTKVYKKPIVLTAKTEIAAAPLGNIENRLAFSQLVRGIPSLKRVPSLTIEPAPVQATAVTCGDFLLWPDPANSRAFFTMARPYLIDFSLMVREEDVAVESGGDTVHTTGSAVFTVGAYPDAGLDCIEAYRKVWTSALADAGYPRPTRMWKFLPLSLRQLKGTLSFSEGQLAKPAEVSTNTEAGTATFLVELTAIGATMWKTAILSGRSDGMIGFCALKVNYYVASDGGFQVKNHTLQNTMSNLVTNVSANAVHVLNPIHSIPAHVIAEGDPCLDSVVVNWQPNEGHKPESLVFGAEGGRFSAELTSEDVSRIRIDWSAVVHFQPAGWPVVRLDGKLSVEDMDWSVIINPASWIVTYSIMVILTDEDGHALPNSDTEDLLNHVFGQVSFSADYLESTVPLQTAFETSNQHLIRVQFPVPDGETPGTVGLSVVAIREGGGYAMQTRYLSPLETFVVVTVSPSADIAFTTNQDPTSEISIESDILCRLAMLD